MLVSIIVITLIINILLYNITILILFLWLCFKTENLFGVQMMNLNFWWTWTFDELENVYKITETLARTSSCDR